MGCKPAYAAGPGAGDSDRQIPSIPRAATSDKTKALFATVFILIIDDESL